MVKTSLGENPTFKPYIDPIGSVYTRLKQAAQAISHPELTSEINEGDDLRDGGIRSLKSTADHSVNRTDPAWSTAGQRVLNLFRDFGNNMADLSLAKETTAIDNFLGAIDSNPELKKDITTIQGDIWLQDVRDGQQKVKSGIAKRDASKKKLSDEERDYILNGQESQHKNATSKKMSLGQILRNRQFWGIALPRFLAEPAWGTFNAWIPLFMFKVYGFNLKEIAMFAWMPMLFADLGCIVGGYLPPLFQRWFGVNLIVSRKMVVTMGALLMIGPGMIGLFTSPYIAIALLCVGGFAHQALSGALITLSSDVFGRNEVATANGLTGMSAWLASTLFALVVGALADTIGFSPLFAVLAVFDLLGALVIWTVLQNKSASEVDSGSQTGDPAPQN